MATISILVDTKRCLKAGYFSQTYGSSFRSFMLQISSLAASLRCIWDPAKSLPTYGLVMMNEFQSWIQTAKWWLGDAENGSAKLKKRRSSFRKDPYAYKIGRCLHQINKVYEYRFLHVIVMVQKLWVDESDEDCFESVFISSFFSGQIGACLRDNAHFCHNAHSVVRIREMLVFSFAHFAPSSLRREKTKRAQLQLSCGKAREKDKWAFSPAFE